MPGSFTNYFENKLIDHIFRGQGFTFPTTLYIGLFTDAVPGPGETTAGTEVSTSGTGYARVALPVNGTASFVAAVDGATSNSGVISFNQATSSWGTVAHVGIFDQATGGNLLAYSSLSTSKAINANDTASFAIGDLDITLD